MYKRMQRAGKKRDKYIEWLRTPDRAAGERPAWRLRRSAGAYQPPKVKGEKLLAGEESLMDSYTLY